MKRTMQAVLIATALATPAFAPLAVKADVSVTFDSGSVAYGYNDGYWDRTHHWHTWPSPADERQWRDANRDHYYDRRHDRDRDMGWHNDNWWNHH